MEPPKRRKLPHETPMFVADGARHFITICSAQRGVNTFARPTVWHVLCEAATYYHLNQRWCLRLMLAMPDHIHLIASFPLDDSMKKVITAWKHYVSHNSDAEWQRDFFDHRLRNNENLDEKTHYIRMNPVRASLVADPNDWKYILELNDRTTQRTAVSGVTALPISPRQ